MVLTSHISFCLLAVLSVEITGVEFLNMQVSASGSIKQHKLETSLNMSMSAREAFNTNGYTLVSGIFTDSEIETLRTAGDRVIGGLQRRGTHLDVAWPGSWNDDNLLKRGRVYGVHGLHDYDSTFVKLMAHQKLGDTFAEVMDKDAVVFHHMKYHEKPAYVGGAFPMHQDRPYFPYRHDSMVGAFIHLDDADKSNGGLSIVPGSHHKGHIPDVATVGHYVSQTDWPMKDATEVKARAGDVVFFSYLTVHGSYPNFSPSPRRMVFIQAYDADDAPETVVDEGENGRGFMLHGNTLEM